MANTCTLGDLDLNPSYLSAKGWIRQGITRELSGGNILMDSMLLWALSKRSSL